MPVISRVGRRHPKVILTVALFYALLVVGGVTMVYPLLLMLSTSLTSAADEEEFRLVPQYLTDDRALFGKYLLAKHESAGSASDRLCLDFAALKIEPVIEALAAAPPDTLYDPAYPARADDYRQFLQGLPDHQVAGGWDHFSVMSLLHGRYRRWLADHVGDLSTISAKYHEDLSDERYIYVVRERPDARDWVPAWDARYRDYRRFKAEAIASEPWLFWAVAGDSKYAKFIQGELCSWQELWTLQFVPCYGPNLDVGASEMSALHLPTRHPLARESLDMQDHLTRRQAMLDQEVKVLAARDPKLGGVTIKVLSEADLWEKFVRTRWPLQLIGFAPEHRAEVDRRFAAFLRERIDVGQAEPGVDAGQPRAGAPNRDVSRLGTPAARGSGDKLALLVELYNRDGHEPAIDWKSWDEATVPTFEQSFGRLRAHYEQFIQLDPGAGADAAYAVPADWFVLDTVEQRWREWVAAKYGHGGGEAFAVANLNLAHGTSWTSLDRLRPPALAFDQGEVVRRPGHWRRQFAWSNYGEVLDLILFHGHALANTFALIVGTIFLALTVNPLAAYALSRFNLVYSHKVLLFLLATMAFPAEVAMIPGFLLIRDLGLLNTFLALLLPGAANGYAIFLLKGFFDTLPKELYEAAQLDGAGELRMFYQVTVPLCKPVFAFLALGAFTAAYGAFLFAMLTCQDPRMWTMMVWLYDLSNRVTGGLQVAAFTIAAVPTLLVFIFCQNIIMKGIILPQIH